VVVPRSLAETPVLLSFGSETSGFSVLVDGGGDPVDSGISSDSLVRGANCQRDSCEARGEWGGGHLSEEQE
jgi:hypothetical protein